jgi:tetratricopeptide (TPR) repeat protein
MTEPFPSPPSTPNPSVPEPLVRESSNSTAEPIAAETLSLCIIVKDEEDNLPRCLDSVAAVVDELVVLDTGSADATPEIAERYGATLHYFLWQDDFAAARNECLKYATCDWVLVLDADEELNPAIAPALKSAIQTPDSLVVNLVRQEIGATQSPYSLVSRLFRRHSQILFSRPYHALIDDSVAQVLAEEPQWQIANLPEVAIFHHGYTPGAIASRNKLHKARIAMERFLVAHPGEPYTCSKLGALYVQMDRMRDGVELLERGLRNDDVDPSVCYELHYHLGIAYSRLQHLDQAAQHYYMATEQPIFPVLKLGAYNNLGGLRRAAGDLEGAEQAFRISIEIDPQFAVGYYNLGMTLKAQNQFHDAIAQYTKAIELNPNYADAYQNLGVALFKLGKMPEGLAAFQKAIALHAVHHPAEAQRLRQGLAQMGFVVG